MERLTEKREGGAWPRKIWSSETIAECLDRLAAYEDTGLEPEEIEKAMDIVKSAVSAFEDFGVDRLAELAQADRDGRCVVLPCQPGDRIWIDGRKAIIEEFFGYKTERYFQAQFDDNMQYIDVPFEEIGKTVFLTREEAKAALRREQDEQ